MTGTLKTLPVAALALAAAGCLQIETSHTLYLSPEGAVVWVAEEKGVRSDERDVTKALAEEDAYLADVAGGTQKMALALAALGPDHFVETRVLRKERPFHVITEAKFDSIERVMQRVFDDGGLAAQVTLTTIGNQVTLRMAFDFTHATQEAEGPSAALLESFETYEFVLTDGAFLAGSGFDINGPTATLSKEWVDRSEKALSSQGAAELVLTWTK